MKVLVTGAAGFIGSHLAERMAAAGHQVRGLDNFDSYYARPLKVRNARSVRAAGCELLEADLTAADLADLVAGSEIVFHAAAQPGNSAVTPFASYVRNNLQATWCLLEALGRSSSLQFFVNISTSSIYGHEATAPESAAAQPVSHYGVTKLAAEQLVLARQREDGIPACSLRLFSVYGERERPDKLFPRLIGSALGGPACPLYEGSREHSRSFTYVADVMDAMERVLERHADCNGEVINIGNDREYRSGELIDLVESLMGAAPRFSMQPRRHGDQLRTCADISKARRLLDFAPRTSPVEGLRREIEWMRELAQETGLKN